MKKAIKKLAKNYPRDTCKRHVYNKREKYGTDLKLFKRKLFNST